MPDAWGRQQGEPALWHGRFLVYRDLGPARTLRAACQVAKDVPPRWYDIAESWSWRERARAWDAAQAARRAQEAEAAREAAARERVAVLRAARGKVLGELQSLTKDDPSYFKVLRTLATITGQLRQEAVGGD